MAIFLFFFFTEKCFLSFEQNKKSFLSALLLFLSCNDSAPDSSQWERKKFCQKIKQNANGKLYVDNLFIKLVLDVRDGTEFYCVLIFLSISHSFICLSVRHSFLSNFLHSVLNIFAVRCRNFHFSFCFSECLFYNFSFDFFLFISFLYFFCLM